MNNGQLLEIFSNSFLLIDQNLQNLPGYSLLIGYIKRSYQNDPYRSLFELGLFIFGVIYVLRKEKKSADRIDLSEKVIKYLIKHSFIIKWSFNNLTKFFFLIFRKLIRLFKNGNLNLWYHPFPIQQDYQFH